MNKSRTTRYLSTVISESGRRAKEREREGDIRAGCISRAAKGGNGATQREEAREIGSDVCGPPLCSL